MPPRWMPDHINHSRDVIDLMTQADILSKLATIQNYHVSRLKGMNHYGVRPSRLEIPRDWDAS